MRPRGLAIGRKRAYMGRAKSAPPSHGDGLWGVGLQAGPALFARWEAQGRNAPKVDDRKTPLRDEDRLAAEQETPLLARLYDIVEPVVERLGFRLVRILLMGGAGRLKLQVMAERPEGGLSVDDCVTISRELDPVLDVADPIAESYVLEVSSPGIDRPLTRVGDFARFAGERVAVELSAPVDGHRRIRGRLVGREGEELLIAGEAGAVRRLPIRQITKAKLLASADLFAGPGRRPRGSNGRGRSGT